MSFQAIPKAFSRPQARYALQTTNLSVKSLHAMLALRGSGRSSAAAGGWSIFAEDSFGQSTLNYVQQEPSNSTESNFKDGLNASAQPKSVKRPRAGEPDEHAMKRYKRIAEGRFGASALENDDKGIDRLEVRIDDEFPGLSGTTSRQNQCNVQATPVEIRSTGQERPKHGRKSRPSLLDQAGSDEEDANLDDSLRSIAVTAQWKPDVRFSFQGPHVFAGVRQLVEYGIVDGRRLPGWMTGEDGVSIGVVRHGRMMKKEKTVV